MKIQKAIWREPTKVEGRSTEDPITVDYLYTEMDAFHCSEALVPMSQVNEVIRKVRLAQLKRLSSEIEKVVERHRHTPNWNRLHHLVMEIDDVIRKEKREQEFA